jgi:hypothetical protein
MKQRKFDKWVIYLIRWANGVPAYIGYTGRTLKERLHGHYYNKCGMFYMKQGLTIEPLLECYTRGDAEREESVMQAVYFPDRATDNDKKVKAAVVAASKLKFENRSKGGKSGGKIGGRIVTSRTYQHSCGKIVKTPGCSKLHSNKCGCTAVLIS